MVLDDKILKIADFGFAKPVGKNVAYTFCGTDDFMAPEILRSVGYTYKVDLWALGVVFYMYPPN